MTVEKKRESRFFLNVYLARMDPIERWEYECSFDLDYDYDLTYDTGYDGDEVHHNKVRRTKLSHLSPKEATYVHNKLIARHNGGADAMHHAKPSIIGWYFDENAKDGVFLKPVLKVLHRAKTASWKDAHKASRQWARHPKRVLRNQKFLDRFDVMRFDKEVERRRTNADLDAVNHELRHNSNLAGLMRMGHPYDLAAYNVAKIEVELRREKNDVELALRGPTVYEVQQSYDSLQSQRSRFDEGDELSYLQELYEPSNLEDLGHQGVWNPSLPAGFNVITDASFDRYGDLNRPKLSLVFGLECFQMYAYENPNRDDAEMHGLRSEYYDDGYDGIYREFDEAA